LCDRPAVVAIHASAIFVSDYLGAGPASSDESAADHRIGKQQRFLVERNIVNPEYGRSLQTQNDARGCRSDVPTRRIPPCHRADEELARGANQNWPAKIGQLRKPRHEVQIFLGRLLGEAEVRIKQNLLHRNSGRSGDLQRTPKKNELVVNHIILFFSVSDRKSTRLNSSHVKISYAVFCLKKKKKKQTKNVTTNKNKHY